MTNSKKFLIWGLGLIILSFISIPGGVVIRECITGNFNGGLSFLLTFFLFVSGYFYFIRGFSDWKTRLLVIIFSLLVFLFLAFIVLSSLGTARQKAPGAGVMSAISSMRAEAEMKVVQDKKTGNYYYPADICNQDVGILSKQFSTIKSDRVNPVCLTDSNFENWAVSSELPTRQMRWGYFCKSPIFPSIEKGSGLFYCVDSTGFAGSATGNITSSSCASVKAETNRQ